MVAGSHSGEISGGRAHQPSSRKATIALALGLVVILSFIRFLLSKPEGAPLPPPPTVTPAEQIGILEACLAAEPQDLRGWQLLGTALVQAATQTGDPSYYPRAERAFQEAESLAPDDPQTKIGKAFLALIRHDFSGAKALAAGVNAADPFNADSLAVLVDAEIELGQYDEAATHLQELLDLRPALPALARTSYLRELHGDLAGAEQATVQALTAGSRSGFDLAVTTSLLGDLYLKQGDLTRAGQRYAESDSLAQGLLTTAVSQARLAVAKGDLAAAVSGLERAVARFPDPGALTLLGEVRSLQGRTEEAASAFGTVNVIATLQQDAGAVVDLELARFEATHGNPETAVDLALAAYRDRPTVFAAEVVGWALHRAGRTEEALGYALESIRLGTPDAALLLHAARILKANGQTVRADELRNQAANLDPWFRVLHPELALG